MLSQQAWNAFLKTLEEPPPRTIFVLATTEPRRCCRPSSTAATASTSRPSVAQLAAVVTASPSARGSRSTSGRTLIARHATGTFRDALGTLEQLVTYAGGADHAGRRARGARDRRR